MLSYLSYYTWQIVTNSVSYYFDLLFVFLLASHTCTCLGQIRESPLPPSLPPHGELLLHSFFTVRFCYSKWKEMTCSLKSLQNCYMHVLYIFLCLVGLNFYCAYTFCFYMYVRWYRYMLWLNFILGLIFISHCFKLIIMHYHTLKQRKIKFKLRINLNHNIYIHWYLRVLHVYLCCLWPFWLLYKI